MGVEVAIAAASLAVTAAGTYMQYQSGKEAQKQQRAQHDESVRLQQEGQAKQQQLSDLQTMRAKRAAAREAQIKRSEVAANAENRGVQSSVVQGARGSLATQAGNQMSFLDTANTLSSQAATLFGQANAIGTAPVAQSNLGSGIASFGGTVFNKSEKIAGFFA